MAAHALSLLRACTHMPPFSLRCFISGITNNGTCGYQGLRSRCATLHGCGVQTSVRHIYFAVMLGGELSEEIG